MIGINRERANRARVNTDRDKKDECEVERKMEEYSTVGGIIKEKIIWRGMIEGGIREGGIIEGRKDR